MSASETTSPAPQAIVFDLGDTLVEYEGLPLSWEAHYADALRTLATELHVSLSAKQLEAACDVLRRFNTRLNPREIEVTFREILDALLPCFAVAEAVDELRCARTFFSVFRQRLRAFPDARPALAKLQRKGIKIGVFTDVPYGMPTELVLEDVRMAELEDHLDAIITSRDARNRKPAPATLAYTASKLGCELRHLVHIGNEKKDIEVAKRAGCRSILVCRTGCARDWGQDQTIASLAEL